MTRRIFFASLAARVWRSIWFDRRGAAPPRFAALAAGLTGIDAGSDTGGSTSEIRRIAPRVSL
jgi:hypothetical protein